MFLHRPVHPHFSFSSRTNQMVPLGFKGRVSFIGNVKRCFPVVLSMGKSETFEEAGNSVAPGNGISIMVSDYFPNTLEL